MADNQLSSVTLKRPINLRVIVTPRWKEEVQQQLQGQVNNFDGQLQQLDVQEGRTVSELQQQGNTPQIQKQIENLQVQVNQKKREILDKKNQALQQLQQVQNLELETEFVQGTMESFFEVKVGDNLINKLNVDLVVRDGVIEEVRGEI